VWCPKIFGDGEQCPVCEYADQLKASPSDEDKSLGHDVDAKEIFLFNAIQGGFKKRLYSDKGQPDIRPMTAGSGVFMGIGQLMTGAGDEQFSRPIHDPRIGFDVMLIRPQEGSGDRWRVTCAKGETPLYDNKDPKEAQMWKGWMSLLINLEEMIKGELKSYDDVNKLLHGEGGPEGGPEGGGAGPEQEFAGPEAAPGTPETAPGGPTEDFGYPEGLDPGGVAPEPEAGEWGPEFGFLGSTISNSPRGSSPHRQVQDRLLIDDWLTIGHR